MIKKKEKWYNNSHLLYQLIIIPPIFFHGLYKSEVIPKRIKIIITVSFMVILLGVGLYFYFYNCFK